MLHVKAWDRDHKSSRLNQVRPHGLAAQPPAGAGLEEASSPWEDGAAGWDGGGSSGLGGLLAPSTALLSCSQPGRRHQRPGPRCPSRGRTVQPPQGLGGESSTGAPTDLSGQRTSPPHRNPPSDTRCKSGAKSPQPPGRATCGPGEGRENRDPGAAAGRRRRERESGRPAAPGRVGAVPGRVGATPAGTGWG